MMNYQNNHLNNHLNNLNNLDNQKKLIFIHLLDHHHNLNKEGKVVIQVINWIKYRKDYQLQLIN